MATGCAVNDFLTAYDAVQYSSPNSTSWISFTELRLFAQRDSPDCWCARKLYKINCVLCFKRLYIGCFISSLDHCWAHMTAQNHSDDGYIAWAVHNPPSPFSVSTYDISSPPPSSPCVSPILFKHIHRVIADLSISLAPVKRLFIILQFGRVQIFFLGHSLEQTAYYCWRALATVLLGPAEASEALLPPLG